MSQFFFAYVLVMQKDVKSDPKIIQDVSIATDSLLESLGALAVEVSAPPKISLTPTLETELDTRVKCLIPIPASQMILSRIRPVDLD